MPREAPRRRAGRDRAVRRGYADSGVRARRATIGDRVLVEGQDLRRLVTALRLLAHTEREQARERAKEA